MNFITPNSVVQALNFQVHQKHEEGVSHEEGEEKDGGPVLAPTAPDSLRLNPLTDGPIATDDHSDSTSLDQTL